MAPAVFLDAEAEEDHEHDEGDNALFFGGEDEKLPVDARLFLHRPGEGLT